jgi:hypothetical protein
MAHRTMQPRHAGFGVLFAVSNVDVVGTGVPARHRLRPTQAADVTLLTRERSSRQHVCHASPGDFLSLGQVNKLSQCKRGILCSRVKANK